MGSSLTLGDVTYGAGLFGNNTLGINPPSSGGGLSPQLPGSITVVPVPAAGLLMMSGLAFVGALRGALNLSIHFD